MAPFRHVSDLPVLPIWDAVTARVVEGQTMTFSIVELAPNAPVARHQHPQEQMGVVLTGTLRFTVGDETRDLHPGDTYAIPGGTVHTAVSGPDGAVVVDVFSPVRDDWRRLTPDPPRAARWPAAVP